MKNNEFEHISVFYDEVLEGLNINPGGTYADLTLGGAGHSLGIISKLDDGLLIGVDQDAYAIKVSSERLAETGKKFKTYHANFENIDTVLDEFSIEKVDGVLIDLGVSSYQFDTADRGFSYRFDSRLDMRMNQADKIDAHYVVNNYSEKRLTSIMKDYADERWASRIAKFIVEERSQKTIDTTFELVDVIKKAIPLQARKDGGHPAKKTFQAIRIEVNDELGRLKTTLDKVVKRLNPGGRLVVITFHSIEDRIVKNKFKEMANPCVCPSDFPICVCGKSAEIKLVNRKAILPTDSEIEQNKRSKSAKLRIIEKI